MWHLHRQAAEIAPDYTDGCLPSSQVHCSSCARRTATILGSASMYESRCARWNAARDAHGSPCGARSLGKRCLMPAASHAAARVATHYPGPGPVSRLCYQQRWLGSTPRWVGLRAKRQPLVERCANRLQRLELAPCPCIALVPTARVPSTVAGFSLVMSFEYSDHPRCSRCARARTRSMLCGTRSAAVASRAEFARSVAIGLSDGHLAGRVWDPGRPRVTCRVRVTVYCTLL